MGAWMCAACGRENPEGTRFCGHCGTPAGAQPADAPLGHLTAPSGTVPGPPPPIEPAPAPDVTEALKSFLSRQVADRVFEEGGRVTEERRLVTALFADLSGFTPLADRLDPEELLEVIDPLIRALTNVVGRYEGYVDKFAGDALLAFFGAPVAHDDDADRALMVAADMHREVIALRADLPPIAGDLSLHIGVNSGHVVARVLGSEVRLDYAVLGDAVILAQRLESAAPPGATYVGETTYQLTRRRFDFGSVGDLTLKGKAQPIPAWRLLGPRGGAADSGGARPSGMFVGREPELAAIFELVEETRTSRGGAAALLGEPGVGKSRLMAEVRSRVPPARWLETRCLSYGHGLAYWPYAELLRTWVGIAPDDTPERARALLRTALDGVGAGDAEMYFARLMALPPTPDMSIEPLEPEAFRRVLHGSFSSWLDRLVSYGPAVVAFEDVHWMDPSSRELTTELAQLCADRPLVLMFTARPEGGPLVADILDRVGHGRSRSIHLGPLDAGAIRRLIENMLDGPPPEQLVDTVTDRAAGNPFFMEEIVRSLRDGGLLLREDGAWTLAQGWTTEVVPATLEGVLSARIDLLPWSAGTALQTASVIGRRVGGPLLRSVLDDGPAVGKTLDRLVEAGLLDRGGDDDFVFHHALVQDVAYSRLLRRRQRALHLKVAESAERLYGAGDDVVDLLARHLYLGEAGPETNVLQYLLRAGERARRLFANDEAIVHYSRAAEVAGRHEDAKARVDDIQLALADLHELIGAYDEARRIYIEVRERSNDVRAWRGIGSTLRRQGDFGEALVVVDRALADPEVAANDVRTLWLERGWCLAMSGQFAGSIEAFRSGLGASETPQDVVDGQLLIEMSRIETDMGNLEAALSHGLSAHKIFQRHEDVRDLVKAMRVVGWTYHDLGRLEESVAMLRDGLELAQRSGSVEEIGGCLINLGLAEMERGNLDEAIMCDLRAISEFERVGHGSGRVTGYANLAEKLFLTGRYAEALDYCARALDLARTIDHRWAIPDVMRTMALIDLEQGRLREAAARAEEAAELNLEMGAVRFAADALGLAAQAWQKAGDDARAAELSARAAALVDPS